MYILYHKERKKNRYKIGLINSQSSTETDILSNQTQKHRANY